MTPTFRLISGNDSIELMNATGALYAGWRPAFAPYKSVYADSSMADGRRLVYQKKNSAVETVNLHVRANCQDDAIGILRRIELMLIEARDYWTKPPSANLDPVYIKVKAANETNERYAIILDGRIDDHASPFEQPFFGGGESLIQSVTLLLERGQWSDQPPGQSASGTFLHTYGNLYNYLEYDATGDYLNCGNDAILENLVEGGFTVEGWFRFSGASGPAMGLVDHHTSAPDTNWIFAVLVDQNGNHSLGGTVYGGTTAHVMSWEGDPQNPAFVPVGEWAYVAMIVTPELSLGTNAFRIRLVINGETAVVSDPGETHVYDASQDLYVGNQTIGTLGLFGDIKWVRISSGDLYPEVETRGQATTYKNYPPPSLCSPPAITSRTIGQWNMDEGTGATVDNATGNASLDGAITNAAWAIGSGCPGDDLAAIGTKGYVAGFDSHVSITDAYRFDASGPTWSGNLIGSPTPYLLYPEPVATGDYLYLGNSKAETDGPFCSAVFDMGTRIDDADWSVGTPQYYNGVAWSPLSGIGDETDGFSTRGISAITWQLPSDWVKADLFSILGGTAPSVNGWWVRIQATVVSAPTDSPEQNNRDIYTINKSGSVIPSGTSVGDLGAVGALTLRQINGVYDSVVIGSRMLGDENPFVPFIHTTNTVHNHSGIAVSGDGADASTSLWPSGERRAASVVALDEHDIVITLDNSVAQFYAGKFRAFCILDLVNTDDMYVTLSYKINDVDIGIYNDAVKINMGTNNNGSVMVDIGIVNVAQNPNSVSQIIFNLNIANRKTVIASSYDLYALALVPVDGDLFLDVSNPSSGVGSKHVGWEDYAASILADKLTVDQVTSPVSGLTASVSNVAGVISANYVTATTSGVLFTPGESTVWFVFYNREPYAITGPSFTRYDSGPHITNAVTYKVAQLYRLMRGTS